MCIFYTLNSTPSSNSFLLRCLKNLDGETLSTSDECMTGGERDDPVAGLKPLPPPSASVHV